MTLGCSSNACAEREVMPVHDWTRVGAGIFHDFHHAWIEEIKRALNAGLLPDDYYALAEQFVGAPARMWSHSRHKAATGQQAPGERPGPRVGWRSPPSKSR